MQRRIAIKVIVLVTVVLSLVLVAVGVSIFHFERQSMEQALRDKGDTLVDFAAALAPAALAKGDTESLQIVLDKLTANAEVLYAAVVGPADAPIVASVAASDPEPPSNVKVPVASVMAQIAALDKAGHVMRFERALRHDAGRLGRRVGHLRIGLSTVHLEEEISRQLVILVVIGLVGFLGASATINGYVDRAVIARLRDDVRVALAVSSGDMTQMATGTGDDELGQLGRALNAMVKNLRTTVTQIHRAADEMTSLSGDLDRAAGEVTTGADDQLASLEQTASAALELDASTRSMSGMATTAKELAASTATALGSMADSARRVGEQTQALGSAVEATGRTVTKVTNAVGRIVGNAGAVERSAQQTTSFVTGVSQTFGTVETDAIEATQAVARVIEQVNGISMPAMQKVIESMSAIREHTEHSTQVIDKLASESDAIGDVAAVIEGVTRQTNLLALNAAIIASQAGEHGRSFAVVADEIKKLADETAASTKSILESIRSIQGGIAEATWAMVDSSSAVQSGTERSAEAAQALEGVVGGAQHAHQMAARIETLMREQTSGIQRVEQAVRAIGESLKQIVTTTREQERDAEAIGGELGRMRSIFQQVNGAIGSHEVARTRIHELVERLNGEVREVSRAADEQQKAGSEIRSSMERVRDVADGNRHLATALATSLSAVRGEARTLKDVLDHFRLER